ncbi:MAG: UDP-N-acetylmuramoyl-L-alanyl-D-glutamate--2,6-diaminopimelate ligase [Burkholderiales bacterium]
MTPAAPMLLHTPEQASQWLHQRVTGKLRTDSRCVRPGDGFLAWPGAASDARHHVPAALAQGAAACLVEHKGLVAFDLSGDCLAGYADLKAACGPIATAYFEHPSRQLDVMAITGTNGKTSTAWWLAQALDKLSLEGGAAYTLAPTGLVGTLGIKKLPQTGVPPEVSSVLQATGLTTPDPVLLQSYLRQLADAGSRACIMEASSIGLAEHRLAGTRIRVAIFTNFSQDHLDYHGSMAAYWGAKARLFSWPGLGAAVINIDDAKGAELAATLQNSGLDIWTVSCHYPARLRAQGITYQDSGLCFSVQEGGQTHVLVTGLIGVYNVSNLLGVLAGMRCLGVPLDAAVQACRGLGPVPGRMQRLGGKGQPLAVVDYAHTPDALDKALTALQPVAQQRGGKLWCVFGCGGDRDTTKRPLMAAVAEKNADQIVVTSDNPRSEKPETIIGQILLGLSHRDAVHVQGDRALAIAQTLAQAHPADVVLIAGKGHEDTQEIAGIKLPFSDVAQVQAALLMRRGKP